MRVRGPGWCLQSEGGHGYPFDRPEVGAAAGCCDLAGWHRRGSRRPGGQCRPARGPTPCLRIFAGQLSWRGAGNRSVAAGRGAGRRRGHRRRGLVGPAALRPEGGVRGEQRCRPTHAPLVTVLNAALQIVVVGLGASIGREVAPRELGALFAGWLGGKAGVSARERRILVACGAGAGLAAVYDVPLSGAVFTVEVLLAEISFATALPALATSAIATIVAGWRFRISRCIPCPVRAQHDAFCVVGVGGPADGVRGTGLCEAGSGGRADAATQLDNHLDHARGLHRRGVPVDAVPSILGNGKALGEVAFAESASVGLLAVLAVAKVLATTATIASGAAGGTLTPSLAVGAALGGSLGGLWSMWWPGTPWLHSRLLRLPRSLLLRCGHRSRPWIWSSNSPPGTVASGAHHARDRGSSSAISGAIDGSPESPHQGDTQGPRPRPRSAPAEFHRAGCVPVL